MPIVRVKNKYQVVIPESVRDQIGVEVGDVLEAKVERGKITLTPKSIVDRIPKVVQRPFPDPGRRSGTFDPPRRGLCCT